MANALTAVRLLLVVPFAFFMAKGGVRFAVFALAAWAVALLTDFADGPIARRRSTVSALSGTFDHTTDFLFVTSGLFAGSDRRGLFAVRHRFVLDSPPLQAAWEQARALQRNALLCSYLHGDCYSPGCAVPAAVAYGIALGAGSEHAGIDGPAPDARRIIRTSPGSLAGEIAGRLPR